MTEPDNTAERNPYDFPLSKADKVDLSMLASILVRFAHAASGIPTRESSDGINPKIPTGDSRAERKERERSVEYLIDLIGKAAVGAGFGANIRAHDFLAHELDYFAGHARIRSFNDQPGSITT